MRHIDHIIRLCVVLVAVVVGFIVVRGFFIPQSFGVYGSYSYGYHRGDSDAEQEILPAIYQGTDKCAKCHAEQIEEVETGGHGTIACETCHGYWQAHNKNTRDKVPKDTSVEACMRCHEMITGRPEDVPQIVSFQQHMKDQESAFEPDAKCVDCHNPHSPE